MAAPPRPTIKDVSDKNIWLVDCAASHGGNRALTVLGPTWTANRVDRPDGTVAAHVVCNGQRLSNDNLPDADSAAAWCEQALVRLTSSD